MGMETEGALADSCQASWKILCQDSVFQNHWAMVNPTPTMILMGIPTVMTTTELIVNERVNTNITRFLVSCLEVIIIISYL